MGHTEASYLDAQLHAAHPRRPGGRGRRRDRQGVRRDRAHVPADVTGTVAATLSLTVGGPATFGAFTPGVGRDYLTTLSANVVSTGADAALAVSDPPRRRRASWSTAPSRWRSRCS